MAKLTPEEQLEIRKKSHKQLMYVGIFSIVMIFAGLSSAYFVSRSDKTWVKIFPPESFYISTVLIVISSLTYWFAVKYLRRGENRKGSFWVILTLLLGLCFTYFQVKGWQELEEAGNYLGGQHNISELFKEGKGEYGKDFVIMQQGKELAYFNGEFYDLRDVNYSSPIEKVTLDVSNNASSFFYLFTGLHIAHLLGGLISLLIVFSKSWRKKYSENDHIGVKVSAIYWHFLDFLWLYLLCLLYFVG